MDYLELIFNRPLEGSFTYLSIDDSPAVGRRVQAMLGKKKLTGYVIGQSSIPPDLPPSVQLRSIERFIDEKVVFNSDLIELARWLARFYLCSFGEALATMIPGGKKNRELELFSGDDDYLLDPLSLSHEQTKALEAITSSDKGNSYLYGITGSGKTEVFLRAAEKTLKEGRGVIYLVPEIALTYQLTELINHRFQAAFLHSGLSPSQRIAQWRKIIEGEVRFVIGARSAIFAPLTSIGLIVIDEEHEASYKSTSTPRYHARQVAMYRAQKQGARLVMGSATPSVEAWYYRKHGILRDIRLGRRFASGVLPMLLVVNLKGSTGSLSEKLVTSMRAVLTRGRQVLLFLNRRGFGYFYHCRSCGSDFSCVRCSVSLIYHKESQRLLCHHCGYQMIPPACCAECGSLDIGFSGFGTEKVEEDVRATFPSFTVARLDADSTKKRGVLGHTLQDFQTGKIDILLGTQMIAKGLNFPGLALVGIIMADSSLNLPDFRSFERTFSLITQVAGRAGRYNPDGMVILQTFNSQHHVIRHAAAHDVQGFYERELTHRQMLKFPPFSRMLRVLVRGKTLTRVRNLSQSIAKDLEVYSSEVWEILGPVECPIALLNNSHRIHIILLAERISRLQSIIRDILISTRIPSGTYVEVDVDPQSML